MTRVECYIDFMVGADLHGFVLRPKHGGALGAYSSVTVTHLLTYSHEPWLLAHGIVGTRGEKRERVHHFPHGFLAAALAPGLDLLTADVAANELEARLAELLSLRAEREAAGLPWWRVYYELHDRAEAMSGHLALCDVKLAG